MYLCKNEGSVLGECLYSGAYCMNTVKPFLHMHRIRNSLYISCNHEDFLPFVQVIPYSEHVTCHAGENSVYVRR